jgi:hypothetical protein
VRRIRSGSSGAGSDKARRRDEATDVADLAQALLGSERQDPRDVLEHVGLDDRERDELDAKLEAGRFEEPAQRVASRLRLSRLDSGDDGLGRPRTAGELPLTQAGPRPGLTNEQPGVDPRAHDATR